MMPPAPTRLSTTTCCPSVSLSFDAMERAVTSVEPPAAAFTIIRIGLVGHTLLFEAACDDPGDANASASAAAVRQMTSGCMYWLLEPFGIKTDSDRARAGLSRLATVARAERAS